MLRKRRERKDAEFLAEMCEEIKTASDAELKHLNVDYHHGIQMDKRKGVKVRQVILRVDTMIEDEMHNRGLKSCDDEEEEIFLSRPRCW